MSKNYIFKVLIAGDAAVGKTSILRRYVDDKFEDSSIMTVGVDFFLKQANFDGKSCVFQLWDLGGQERFRHLMHSYVAGASGALLLIDLTRELEIKNILDWVNIVRLHDINLPIILVGTKCDLNELITISKENLYEIRETFKMIAYILTSAKSGHNVQKTFDMMALNLLKK